MSLLTRFKKTAVSRAPAPTPPPIVVDFNRTYHSLPKFKGTRRLHITLHGDIEHGLENATAILGDKEYIGCTRCDITLTGFRYDSGTGIKVAVDGRHIGVVWYHPEDDRTADVFKAAYANDIEGVYVRIERNYDHVDAGLFVLLTD